jgi:hypothetical protein
MADPIKIVMLLQRRHDLSLEQFSDHWYYPHAEHAFKIKLIYRYAQDHRMADPLPGISAPADGIPQVWFKSFEIAAMLQTDPDYLEGAYLDEPNFMEGRAAGAAVSERVVVAGSGGLKRSEQVPKAIFVLKRRPDLTREAFLAAWNKIDRPWFCPAEGLRRFVKSAALPENYADGEPPFDAVEEVWWPDGPHFQSAIMAARHEEITALCAPDGIRGMRVREELRRWDD